MGSATRTEPLNQNRKQNQTCVDETIRNICSRNEFSREVDDRDVQLDKSSVA